MNGVSAGDFTLDMGFSLKRAIALDEEAVRILAECGGLNGRQLKELLSWTGEPIEDVQMMFRHELFGSRALRNPIIRGCPVCLREGAEQSKAPPLKDDGYAGPLAVSRGRYLRRTQTSLGRTLELRQVDGSIRHLGAACRIAT